MYHSFMTIEVKFNRVLMEERSFNKEELEVEILTWMPFQVSDAKCSNCGCCINASLILLA